MFQLYLPYPSVHFWIYRNYSNNWSNPRFSLGLGVLVVSFRHFINCKRCTMDLWLLISSPFMWAWVLAIAARNGTMANIDIWKTMENVPQKNEVPWERSKQAPLELVDVFVGWCVFIWFPTIGQWGWTYQCVRDSKGGSSLIPGQCELDGCMYVLEARTFFVFDLFSMSHQTCNLPQKKQDIFLIKKSISNMSASSMLKKKLRRYNAILLSELQQQQVRCDALTYHATWELITLVVGSFWISLAEFIIPKTPQKKTPSQKEKHTCLPTSSSHRILFQHLPASQLSGVFVVKCYGMIQIHAVNKQRHIFHPVALLSNFLRNIPYKESVGYQRCLMQPRMVSMFFLS